VGGTRAYRQARNRVLLDPSPGQIRPDVGVDRLNNAWDIAERLDLNGERLITDNHQDLLVPAPPFALVVNEL